MGERERGKGGRERKGGKQGRRKEDGKQWKVSGNRLEEKATGFADKSDM